MSTDKVSKINLLLSQQPQGIVFQSAWLQAHGYSYNLQKRYRESKWLEPIGDGAMKRFNDSITYEGGLYALQKQSGMSTHPGGKTALQMQGLAHYILLEQSLVFIFGSPSEQLPLWFKKYNWGVKLNYHASSFLPPSLELVEKKVNQFSILISSPLRALMECLYLAPDEQDLMECYHLMEGLNNIRPSAVQEMLECCGSIKVKRLFLYLAEKAGHAWFARLNPEKINLGKGKRSIVTKGVYNSKYQITVPEELENYDQR